ncbi:MAG: glycosyltransferase [Bacteroidia bacterium]|nr:glycosyltransferase [Bacteroidia bacterium]
MSKPILIDALYLHMAGALAVQNRLLDGLVQHGVSFVLLKDARCPKYSSEDYISKVIVMNASVLERTIFYIKHRNDFSKVVCMANVPPTIRLRVPVTTYFHNLTILKIPSNFTFKRKCRFWIRRLFMILWSHNTDSWIVQTQNSEDTLRATIPNTRNVYQFPIYMIPDSFTDDGRKEREGFLFVGEYSYAKGHDELLEAWKILNSRGLQPTLHLTVSKDCTFASKIKEEVNIINHGFIPYLELADIYKSCKALVYPSRNESLGLGLIEAATAGCDILSSDLPFTYSVCKPSVVFDPTNPRSIADAIYKYMKGEYPKSELTIRDHNDEFIEFIEKM